MCFRPNSWLKPRECGRYVSNKNERTTIIMSKELKDKLIELANSENRSLSNYIVNVLENHINLVMVKEIHKREDVLNKK